ncbi:type II toxin-antitoxin system RelE/ParE family toxin [Fulvivirga maritima]|uniref:type II toxin-antitoxin system RelE/ParE family toxin n=1 Tax=Fulvivirga maritima TaxID=2904247 RepID=UPI001F3CD988|nr:type II toxin-antitoxin system RelE/ParE family toxin [Fulvivirga maritima]UII28055.1 type II toxin-antitoxin system RelE/ParE family toxin [Fulvivirga maritima]
MSYQLIIEPGAETDIKRLREWYEDKQEGLGDRFLKMLDFKLTKVLMNPYQYQVRYKSIVRMAFIKVFPVAIHYEIESNNIYVLAVLGTQQSPGFWR